MLPLLASIAIAPVRKGALQHGRWIEIRKGKHKCVLCSCGGHIEDAPHDFSQTIDIAVCTHLTALYTGAITEDPRKGQFHAPYRYYVRLTQLGSQMFRWRWSAQTLGAR